MITNTRDLNGSTKTPAGKLDIHLQTQTGPKLIDYIFSLNWLGQASAIWGSPGLEHVDTDVFFLLGGKGENII